MDSNSIVKTIKTENIRYILLHFLDIPGLLRGRTVPASIAQEVLEEGVGFDGSSIPGFVQIQESDMVMLPDSTTFKVLPNFYNGKKVASMICDIYRPGRKRFEKDPRFIAQKLEQKLSSEGIRTNVAPELEFFVVQQNNGSIRPVEDHIPDNHRYFDISPGRDLTEEYRMEFCDVLENAGLIIERHHHEVAPGQNEITFKYDTLTKTCDQIILYKFLAKALATKRGWIATFMPRPFFGMNGSGMHCHFSFSDLKTGINLFSDPKEYAGLSQMCRYFIGGLLDHARALSALVSPTVNSYKRLVPGIETPVYVVWSRRNRSALIRVPEYFPGSEKEARIEIRSPDPLCNPYLAFPAIIEAGLDGIKKKMEPGEPIEQNVYKFTESKLKQMKIKTLPKSQKEALDEWESDDIVIKTLGSEVAESFRELMLHHWEEYTKYISGNEEKIDTINVTPWEHQTYLYA